ncbi:hypothetical protein Tco_1165457 [Tanacetum coccineum]
MSENGKGRCLGPMAERCGGLVERWFHGGKRPVFSSLRGSIVSKMVYGVLVGRIGGRGGLNHSTNGEVCLTVVMVPVVEKLRVEGLFWEYLRDDLVRFLVRWKPVFDIEGNSGLQYAGSH